MKHYTKEQFVKDLLSGVIVAIIALPLSIALAIASGVSPEKGLYTAIIAGFFISFLGGSRVQIGGPTGAFMVIVLGIVTQYGYEGLVIATIMAGIFMILLGLFKLGSFIKFIPFPITTGFTSGIALVIFSSQIKDFFGLNISEVPSDFIEKWGSYFSNLGSINWAATLLGILSVLIIVLFPKISKKIPGALVALVLTSLLVRVFGLDVETIGSKFGELSSKFPSFSFPDITFDKIKVLISPAIVIALLGSIESLLSAVVSDGMIGSKHRSNMELVAQGTANIASVLFQGIPATGAIARTVANIKNGGRTPIAGIVHSLTLLLILLLFMPLAKMIPLSSLAAILFVVAYNMSEWREFKNLFSSPKSDVLVLVVTFLLTVMVDLVVAIEVGMILAVFLFMKRMSEISSVNFKSLDSSEDEVNFDFSQVSKKYETDRDIIIYEINGPFFFGAADKFLDLINTLGEKNKHIIIGMKHVPVIDATALHAFKRMLNTCDRHHIDVYVTGVGKEPYGTLKNAGLTKRIGEDHFLKSIEEAKSYLQEVKTLPTTPQPEF
ncbi:MAG: sulfate permease [Vallitaleaceae bacterium]|nr:sulfate permease [Vallitaleaceae bacterium]MBN2696229.1 sulfate permease [Bacilli bacterium]